MLVVIAPTSKSVVCNKKFITNVTNADIFSIIVNKIFRVYLIKLQIVNIVIRFICCQNQAKPFFRIMKKHDRNKSFMELSS